jgi:hypothetical protein
VFLCFLHFRWELIIMSLYKSWGDTSLGHRLAFLSTVKIIVTMSALTLREGHCKKTNLLLMHLEWLLLWFFTHVGKRAREGVHSLFMCWGLWWPFSWMPLPFSSTIIPSGKNGLGLKMGPGVVNAHTQLIRTVRAKLEFQSQ